MKIKEITAILSDWAPLTYAEDFDNVGLLVGNEDASCQRAMITHDVSETVVAEAVHKKCELIICFHPIIFGGLTSLTGKNYVEKTVLKAIENKIAIYAIHTALDNHQKGISYQLGKTLGLRDQQILIPKKDTLLHLSTYVPSDHKETVLAALHEAGAGTIGNYTETSFSVTGEGRYKGNELSQPSIGEKNKSTTTTEEKLRLIIPKHSKNKVMKALMDTHPYESVAYELTSTLNSNPTLGLGSIGTLPKAMASASFLTHLKTSLGVPFIRHSMCSKKEIKKVAVLGGSGSFCIDAAMSHGADALVTADLKYHDFFKAENNLLLVDAGHYETEHFTKKLIHEYLTKKMPNFAFTLSEVNTNPVKYF